MKTRTAIAWEPNRPLEIEEIDLEGAKEGEVLVRIVTTSLCHTDVFTLSGEDPAGQGLGCYRVHQPRGPR